MMDESPKSKVNTQGWYYYYYYLQQNYNYFKNFFHHLFYSCLYCHQRSGYPILQHWRRRSKRRIYGIEQRSEFIKVAHKYFMIDGFFLFKDDVSNNGDVSEEDIVVSLDNSGKNILGVIFQSLIFHWIC